MNQSALPSGAVAENARVNLSVLSKPEAKFLKAKDGRGDVEGLWSATKDTIVRFRCRENERTVDQSRCKVPIL